MIPISHPLASSEVSEMILNIVKDEIKNGTLVSGVKACQKAILDTENPGIFILNGNTYPMDLISHMPILCEHRSIPYIFVKDSSYLNGFTCVIIKAIENENVKKILEACCLKTETK